MKELRLPVINRFVTHVANHKQQHAPCLPHQFSVESKHVFQKNTTDNVMDYSDIGPLQISVVATWRYQWEHLHKVLRPIEDKTNKTKEQ